jgi:hypothetical protein
MTTELKTLGLAAMHSNALAAVGVKTFGQLLDVEVYELRRIPNLGAKGIDAVLSLVTSKGHKLLGQDLYDAAKVRKQQRKLIAVEQEAKIIEEFKNRLAKSIEAMPFGDTAASFAVYVRNFK